MTEISEKWNAFGTAAVLTPILMLTLGLVLIPVSALPLNGYSALGPLEEMVFVAAFGLPLSVVLGLPLYASSLPAAWRIARAVDHRRAGLRFSAFGLVAAIAALPLWFAAIALMGADVVDSFQTAIFLTLMGCLYAPLYGAIFGRVFAASLGAARRRALMTTKGATS